MIFFVFFFNDTATTEIYTLSLHDALPIYLYFQLPLMILLIMPALLGLRADWREGATSLGATPTQFWTRVGLPLLAPSLLGSLPLLFAHALRAYSTALTPTRTHVELVTVQIT